MKRAFESLERSVQEASRFAQGQTEGAKVHELEPLDIKEIRQQVQIDPSTVRPPLQPTLTGDENEQTTRLQRPQDV
ncbi:MAG: hypothetical protein RRB13_15620 [bacterium]|nr:hypothetical protein [bacterium]